MTTARIRDIVAVLAFMVGLVCVILLLNVTAGNPTGRRYSSEIVDLSTTSSQKGRDGERILARDLGVSLTNERESRADVLCLCNSRYETAGVPAPCHQCVVYSDAVSNFRIPDITTDTYLAESKNAESLLPAHGRDYQQLEEMGAAAVQMGIPLWIYVRVDTLVHRDYVDMARITGGAVVMYFAYDGYRDPIDDLATVGLVLAVLVITGVILWRSRPADRISSSNPVDDAPESIDATEEFMDRVERLSRKELDEDDAQRDQSNDQ